MDSFFPFLSDVRRPHRHAGGRHPQGADRGAARRALRHEAHADGHAQGRSRPQRDMMASINAGVTDVPGHDRRGDALLPGPLRPPDPPGGPGRQLPGPALQRDGHAPLDRVEPPERRDEAADHHRHDLPAPELPHRVLRAELRLPGPGVARADVELLRARHRARTGDRRLPRRRCSAGGAGWAARPSERSEPVPRQSRADRRGRADPPGRSAVWASYSVHQASQPVGHREAELLAPVDQRAHRLLLLADERKRAGLGRARSVSLVHSDSSRCQASRRASTMAWVPSAMSARMPASPSARTSAARSQP